jgi:hypothetical protein
MGTCPDVLEQFAGEQEFYFCRCEHYCHGLPGKKPLRAQRPKQGARSSR